jgi:hypothetical protein
MLPFSARSLVRGFGRLKKQAGRHTAIKSDIADIHGSTNLFRGGIDYFGDMPMEG